MKLPVLLIMTAALSALLGGWLGSQFFTPEPEDRLDGDEVARLNRSVLRLDELEAEFIEMRDSRPPSDSSAVATTLANHAEQLRRLRKEIAELAGHDTGPGDKAGLPGDEKLDALLEERLNKVEAKRRQRKKETSRQFARTWAKEAARKSAGRLAKVLNLDQPRTDRIATYLAESNEANTPHFGTLKGGEGSNDDRLAAIEGIRASWRDLDANVRGELSTEQYEQYLETQEEARTEIDTWITDVEQQIRSGRRNG